MADKSKIEWTNATWNPVTGCSKVSPGCANCYAETLTMRFARPWRVPGLPWTPNNAGANVILRPERLSQPVRWTRPRLIFVNSLSDVFHELIPLPYIARIFAIMALAPRHTFQVLTKRPERMKSVLNASLFPMMMRDEALAMRREGLLPRSAALDDAIVAWDIAWPLENVWLGTSIENRRFVERAEMLRQTPASIRFISAEPLLGPLLPDADYMIDADGDRWEVGDADIRAWRPWADDYQGPGIDLTGIDWLIVGGESGSHFRDPRELHRFLVDADGKPRDDRMAWLRDLREVCATDAWEWDGREGVTAYFVKQLGGLRPGDSIYDLPEDLRVREYPTKELTAA